MFTIEDAIERCRHIAEENQNMPRTAAEWEQTAKWLEALQYAPDTILEAKLSYALVYPDETMCDMRDRQKELTIKEIVEILEGLSV